jgi:PAS domain S-box-containing protein
MGSNQAANKATVTAVGARLALDPNAPGPAKVLVVEDEQIVALELRDRVARMGHAVVAVVASGEQAIEATRRLRPDLILMDIKLQGALDGIDAASSIRTFADIPIVYLTAFADDATLQRAKVTEPYGYILKPFQERELHVVIEVSLYRHRMERALRESEAWRFALLRSVGDAVLATGIDGRVKFMNPLAGALTGWRETEAIGAPIDDVFKTIQPLERRGSPWKDLHSKTLIGKDGSERLIEVEFAPIRDAGGTPMGTVFVFRDTSDRKRLQDRQRFMVAASGAIASSLDLDRSDALGRITSLIARNCADWCVIHLVDAQGWLRAAAFAHRDASKDASASAMVGAEIRDRDRTDVAAVARTQSSVLESDVANGDWIERALGIPQALIPNLVAASAVTVPLPVRHQCLGTLTLVSETRARPFTEADLIFAEELGRRLAQGIDNARLYSDAQRAIHMRDEVLEVVSHDLRDPLSTISMNAEQLARTPAQADPQRVLKNAASIHRNADRMSRLIKDLLDIGRIDSGRLSLELRRIGAVSLVHEGLSTFEALASELSIRLASEALPDAELLCDRARVLQVLSNLIGNALKFSPKGGAIVVSGEMGDGVVQFSVADEGSGIAPEQVDHVFDRHWQAPDAIHRGSGLGLYIAKGIVEAHGGHIWVDSVQGRGSTFHFTIPLADQPEERLSTQ